MDAMDGVDLEKRARVVVNIFLPTCALLLSAFYLLMFRRDNAAPVIDLAGFSTDGAGFQHQMERCWSSNSKVAATGWVAREGRGGSARSVRIVIIDDEDGEVRALKTTQLDRIDVNGQMNRRPGRSIRYRNAGFVSSLDLAAADPPIRPGALYIAYDDGDARVLLPIPCRAGPPR